MKVFVLIKNIAKSVKSEIATYKYDNAKAYIEKIDTKNKETKKRG